MIRFEGASKRFAGSARFAVDHLDLDVPEGTTCVLLGPSGCGKSTSLRMVNRLAELDSGRVLLAGSDVARSDPVLLRRGIGYVLQGVGLFPHRTVAQNVATVPELLGWPRSKIADRVEAMLDLVGLDPAQYRDRRPGTLSGGQRQRVGVARALASDPPILLMDEPFGAVDPVVRSRLQSEMGAILKRLRKTVLIVTHDIAEAMLMGDRIAILREGRLVQSGTPAEILAAPIDDFVSEFVGQDRSLKRLSLVTVEQTAIAGSATGEAVSPTASLQSALSQMLGAGLTCLRVDDPGATRVITLEAIQEVARDGRLSDARSAERDHLREPA